MLSVVMSALVLLVHYFTKYQSVLLLLLLLLFFCFILFLFVCVCVCGYKFVVPTTAKMQKCYLQGNLPHQIK